ncbi:MAG: hypothetical protein ACR2QW_16485 [bacterium]
MIVLPLQPAFADWGSPIAWMAEGASIKGQTRVVLYSLSNDTGETLDVEVVQAISETIRNRLIEDGFEIVSSDDTVSQQNTFTLKTSVIFCPPGSVSGRWVGFGAGAAVCIIRSYLLKPESKDPIGEIIVVKQVEGGGIFSAGAEKSVARKIAKDLVKEITILVGLEN